MAVPCSIAQCQVSKTQNVKRIGLFDTSASCALGVLDDNALYKFTSVLPSLLTYLLSTLTLAGLKRAAHGSLKTQDTKKSPKIAIWAPLHNFVGLYLRN